MKPTTANIAVPMPVAPETKITPLMKMSTNSQMPRSLLRPAGKGHVTLATIKNYPPILKGSAMVQDPPVKKAATMGKKKATLNATSRATQPEAEEQRHHLQSSKLQLVQVRRDDFSHDTVHHKVIHQVR